MNYPQLGQTLRPVALAQLVTSVFVVAEFAATDTWLLDLGTQDNL